MNKDLQLGALAKLDGFKHYGSSCNRVFKTKKWADMGQRCPDYLGNKSVITVLVMKRFDRNSKKQDEFINELLRVMLSPVEAEFGPLNMKGCAREWFCLTAEAPQIAEALLRVEKLWVEEPVKPKKRNRK